MTEAIPKIIHYCWFGRGKLPEDTVAYIRSWKKYLPDYKIIEWNEDNFDIDSAPSYVREAYQAKKYAFVSDFVRMKALYDYGGLYFDTDLEVIKDFHQYLEGKKLVLAFESKRMLMTAFIACIPQHEFIQRFLSVYDNRHFIKEDGSYDDTPNTDYWSVHAENIGVNLDLNSTQILPEDVIVYPEEIFCGYDMYNCHERITDKTCTVHHMACSWADSYHRRRTFIIRTIQKVIGTDTYDRVRKRLKRDNS